MSLYYIPREHQGKYSLLTQDEQNRINHQRHLSKQILKLCKLLEMPGEEFNLKQVACTELQEVLRKYYPECLLVMFGSSVNGFGFKNCVLDLLFLPFPGYCNLDFIQSQSRNYPSIPQNIPKPATILSGKTSRGVLSNFNEWSHLEFVKSILLEEKTNVNNVVFVRSKSPSLKLFFSNSKLVCELSASNRFAVFNSELFQFFLELDARVKPLVLILTYWGMSLKFIRQKFFSTHAFTLLIIFFLQNVNPPILPSVKHLMDLSKFSRIIAGWQTAFTTDESSVQKSKNTATLNELLFQFFEYYFNFDFSQFIVCPFSGQPLPMNDLKKFSDSRLSSFEISSISIQDPFILSQNIFKAKASRTVFKLALLTACKILKQKDKYKFLTLFDISAYQKILDDKYYKYMTGRAKACFISLGCNCVTKLRNTIENCQLWYEKICQTVYDVLQYGLLFECEIIDKTSWSKNNVTVCRSNDSARTNLDSQSKINGKLKLNSTSYDLDYLMSIQCIVYHRVWRERNKYYHIAANSVNDGEKRDFRESALEVEYKISMEMAKTNEADIQDPLLCFICDLYKHTSPQIPDVLVLLKPIIEPSNEFFPVATFLASYIPKTVTKLLFKHDHDVIEIDLTDK